MLYLHVLIVLLLAALTLSCPPPLNNMRFVGNSTHSTSQLIEAALLAQGLGWTEQVTPKGLGNLGKPWTRRKKDNIAYIPFCFYTENDYKLLGDTFLRALEMWFKRLGQPSKDAGHGVKFVVNFENGRPVLCTNREGSWNKVNDDASVIISVDNDLPSSALATIGWEPTDRSGNHRNQLVMNPKNMHDDVKAPVAHEIGHVIGLTHEHQRDDRDDYLDFKCENLIGYGDAKKKAEGDGISMDDVCKSEKLCLKYSFLAGIAFAIDIWNHDTNSPTTVVKGMFDSKSIMLYESDLGIGEGKDEKKYTDVPPAENCEIFGAPTEITDLDLAGVKALYPWQYPPSTTSTYLGGIDMARACREQHDNEHKERVDVSKGCNGWTCWIPDKMAPLGRIDTPRACVSQFGLGATAKCGPNGAFDWDCWRD